MQTNQVMQTNTSKSCHLERQKLQEERQRLREEAHRREAEARSRNAGMRHTPTAVQKQVNPQTVQMEQQRQLERMQVKKAQAEINMSM